MARPSPFGANGGAGSALVQLARAAGVRVVGTASARNHPAVEQLGAIPVDYRGDVPEQVRALAPNGVDAVFDHVGGPRLVDSFRLLAPNGTLVSYSTASTKDVEDDSRLPVPQALHPVPVRRGCAAGIRSRR
ncbi:zinc-binding dehydrogenase [Nocardia sp. NPDC055049]